MIQFVVFTTGIVPKKLQEILKLPNLRLAL